MPIFEVTKEKLMPINQTTFGTKGIYERKDIQRLLKSQIEILDEGLLVIAEEFGDWLDSSRRIDLLCIDREANLVVIELKRTEDGGHMELQALRYAAMVSNMTFSHMLSTYTRFLLQNSKQAQDETLVKAKVLQFLGWDDINEDKFAQDVRIILASADFSKELTTLAMWLNERNIDIRCVRLKPYRMENGTMLLDVQQLIPLPEASLFQTQIGIKKQAELQNTSEMYALRLKFWGELLDYAKTQTAIHENRNPTKESWISGSIDRAGFSLIYTIRQSDSQVELWISHGSGQGEKNKADFEALRSQHEEIELEFGEALDWQELPDREGCRIRKVIEGGYRSQVDDWPTIHEKMVEVMIKLDKVMRPRVAKLQLHK